jgi:hypothetical protein
MQAIDDYAARFPDAFRNIRYGDAARILRELLDEVIEAGDAQRDSTSPNLIPTCRQDTRHMLYIGDTKSLLDPPSASHRNGSADMIKAADLLAKARDPETVVMAELPDGRQFKITGYERAAIWARRPETERHPCRST